MYASVVQRLTGLVQPLVVLERIYERSMSFQSSGVIEDLFHQNMRLVCEICNSIPLDKPLLNPCPLSLNASFAKP